MSMLRKRPVLALILSLTFCASATLAFAQSPAPSDGQDGSDIVVRLKKDGETFVVDVEMLVQASPQAVWEVLTDYDHMARFMGNVQSSRITERQGNTLTIAQRSGTEIGLIKLTFENVRQVELVPRREIRSRVISGDMKDSAYTTRLVSDDGGGTRVVNHGEFVPTMWVPPLIGDAFLASETRRQFFELRREMLRRVAAHEGTGPALQ
jgi:uncharacterized protein YndB with AHSA1/START domain